MFAAVATIVPPPSGALELPAPSYCERTRGGRGTRDAADDRGCRRLRTTLVRNGEAPRRRLPVGSWLAVAHVYRVICSVTVVEWERLPLVPVIVSVKLPRRLPVFTVRVEPAEPPAGGVTLAGLKLAVAPAGRPLTASATDPEKPLVEPMVTVYVPLELRETLSDPGLALILKSGTFTTSVTVVE